jgi:hypothetical protein
MDNASVPRSEADVLFLRPRREDEAEDDIDDAEMARGAALCA